MSISGDRIRACRIRMRLTQEDVAKHLGIGKQAVYKYESGAVTNIPLENVEALAKLFSVTPAYIAGWDEDKFQRHNQMLCEDNVEQDLLLAYRSLSVYGKNLLIERANELKILYGKKSENNTAESV